jgi:hypothetical protein
MVLVNLGLRFAALAVCLAGVGAQAQVIEFDSGGFHYQALTQQGITVMFARLPTHLKDYAIVQVTISNGSKKPCTVRPEDFRYTRTDGTSLQAEPARTVINRMLDRGNRSDVVKLVSTYEQGLYGLPRQEFYKGYEARRESALADFSNPRIKAAAAASAIALAPTKLAPGESIDGAVFYPTTGKPLGPGTLMVTAGNQRFNFNAE